MFISTHLFIEIEHYHVNAYLKASYFYADNTGKKLTLGQ